MQIKPRKHVPDHAGFNTSPSRQREVDHTDQESICLARQISIIQMIQMIQIIQMIQMIQMMNCSAVVGIDHADHTDHLSEELKVSRWASPPPPCARV